MQSNLKWASQVFLCFLAILIVFNSQSMINYSKTLDVNEFGVLTKKYAQIWHGKMKNLGLNGPRKLIENGKSRLKKYEFQNSNIGTDLNN